MRLNLVLGMVLGMLVVAGCGSEQPISSRAPNGPCVLDDINAAKAPFLECVDAIAMAERRLGGIHWPITSVTFGRSLPCPPNARCAAPGLNLGIVIFRFWFGDPVMVVVTRDDAGVLAAADPEPVPSALTGP